MRTREGLPFGHAGCPITGKTAGKFIDTGHVIRVGNKVQPLFIHHAAATILGRHVGMLDREDAAALRADVITLNHRISQLEDELSEADAFIDGTEALARKGLQVKRPPGRPKKKVDQE